ncbi:MAG: ABC transporter substrate-binding protein [Bacillota bacterium]|nr:ABC transporter substrate-binding protein [Bacillota bacterium]
MKRFIFCLTVFCSIIFFTGIGSVSADDSSAYAGETINVYNWGEYISDGSDGLLNINAEFTKETGIKVNYSTYENNEELYAKLLGGGVSYDVIVPSDYMIARMIKKGLLQKLNFSNIPNYQYIDSRFKTDVDYDPENQYSVPYAWGRVCLIYNKKMVTDPVNSWNILWNPKYQGKILMFDNPRDAFGIAEKVLGYSQNTTDSINLVNAAQLLKKQKTVVQSYVNDQIFDKMAGNEAILAPYYSGDALTILDDNENIGFSIPKEGTNLFVDAMCIPACARHKAAAEAYINFLCKTDIALNNIEYIQYSSPQKLAAEKHKQYIFKKYGKIGLDLDYPNDLSNTETYTNLPEDTNLLMDKLWVEIKTNENISLADTKASGYTASTLKLITVISCFAIAWIAIFLYKRRRKRFC